MNILHFAILTVSDRSARGEREDLSGPALSRCILQAGWEVVAQKVVPDTFDLIHSQLKAWCTQDIHVILTTGGTGFSPTDVTPEATCKVIERATPGLSEAMRLAGMRLTPHAMLSRGVAGICGQTLIINLPGSPKAAQESFEVIKPVLEHAVAIICEDTGAEDGHQIDAGEEKK